MKSKKKIQSNREVDTRNTVKVVTSNNFLKAVGLENISLKARKLLYLAMSQCKINDTEFFEYSISIKDFATFMGVASSNLYEAADSITDELMHGFIKYIPEGEKDFEKFQLFKKCKYKSDEGIIFQISEEMTSIMLDLRKDFTQALLNDFAKMKSNYSIEIWHWMQKEMHSRKPAISETMEFDVYITDLRRLTGTENKFSRLSQFKEKVFDKALREIKENCFVDIAYTHIKDGRKIVGFHCIAKSVFYVDMEEVENRIPLELKERVEKKSKEIQEKRHQMTI